MPFTIENHKKDIKRIRIKFESGVFTVMWPEDIDIEENDREFKIHSAIKRSYAHHAIFAVEGVSLSSNVQLNRLDKFDAIDLYWEENR